MTVRGTPCSDEVKVAKSPMLSRKLVGTPLSSYAMVFVLPMGFVVVSGCENAL